MIDLNGADNVTIDGRVNATGSAKDLVVTNTSISNTSGTSTIRFIADASTNTIKYCAIKGSSIATDSGILFFSTGTTTGNDGNTIDNNNITNAADANRPVNVVFSSGTANKENSGYIISNNNIYDFLNRSEGSYGINIGSNTTAWTIIGNSFYQTAPFAPTANVSCYIINIYNASGLNFTISNNYIGGRSANCGGSAFTKTNGASNPFYGIQINVGTGTASNVQGNIIKNLSWSNLLNEEMYCIRVDGGDVNIGTTSGNTIGNATGNGSITFTNTTSSGNFFGVYLNSTGLMNVGNNVIGSITVANSNTANCTNFFGIYRYATGTTTISNNTIGSTDDGTTNSINASSISTSINQSVLGIHNQANGTISITGNTISKLTNSANNSPGNLSYLFGVKIEGGTNTVSNNLVRDLSIACENTDQSFFLPMTGIWLSSSSAGAQTISNNTIYNLWNTYASFTGRVIGIYYDGPTTASTISNNFIHSLSVNPASTNAILQGITHIGGNATFVNNVISLGGNIPATIYGIVQSTTTNPSNYYHNTVYISGIPTKGSLPSYSFYSGTSNTRNVRNNLFINARSNSGASGSHYAVGLASISTLTIDFNDYYVSGTGGVLGSLASSDKTSLLLWKGATSQDANSVSTAPSFFNAGGTLSSDYVPQPPVLLPGTVLAEVTSDYDGRTRAATPTMGSFESLAPVGVTATAGTATGYFNTLREAFVKINDGTHKGDITIKLNAKTTNTTIVETATATLNASGTGSASYSSVLIYPTLKGIVLSGSIIGPLINLDGADNVTIDGRVNQLGEKDLTIVNTSGTINNSYAISAIRLINSAENNNVKYCTIKASAISTTGGILLFSTSTAGNGNSGNNIDHCDLTQDASRPYQVIYSNGSAGFENKNNTVSNCNIYNFFRNTQSSTGIYISSNSSDWVITGNNLYESSVLQPAVGTLQHTFILINNTGNNFNVSDNFIGGTASDHSGTWTLGTTDFQNIFMGIYMSVGTTTASSVQNNIIQGIAYTSASTSPWNGIYINAGNVNIGTTTGNNIGSVAGPITITGPNTVGSQAISYGIYNKSTGSVAIENSNICAITTVGSATIPHSFYGIRKTSVSGTTSISNNTIGSATSANSINASSTSTVGGQNVYGIHCAGTGTNSINGNTVANLTNGTTATTGQIIGIYTLTGANTVTNNHVHHLTIANENPLSNEILDVAGISVAGSGAAQTVSGNKVHDLSNSHTSFAGSVAGLYLSLPITAVNTISQNFIYNISVNASSTGANISGIKIASGLSTYSNNIISLGGTTSTMLYGIYETGDVGNDNNLYFNTVHISGNSASNPSYALYSAVNTNTRDFRNNIFNNVRSSSSDNNYAMYIAATGGNLTCVYNNYFVSGTGGMLGYYGGDKSTIPIVTGVTGNDALSKNVSPGFASAGGTVAENYLPSASSLVADIGTGITTDYDGGNARSETSPAIGAYEYAVTPPVTVTATSGTQGPSFYGTLKDVFDKINDGTHKGAITIKINGGTTETASAVLNASGTNTASYTSINIYPTNTGLSINGNLTGVPLIDLNGADNVTIDGRVNATGSVKDLVISNTSAETNQFNQSSLTIQFINDASANTVKYCTIKGSSFALLPETSGIMFFSTGVVTGNDGNTIEYNNFTNAGSRPLSIIYSLGTTGFENSGNIVRYNNFYDFFNLQYNSYGINLGSYNTAWTISDNSFYETASLIPVDVSSYYFINISNAGVGYTVSNNHIGGSSADCGGSAFAKTNAFSKHFYGILINVGTGTPSNVQGNIIKNISWSNPSQPYFYGIKVNGGDVNIGTTMGNCIGEATGNGSITFTNGKLNYNTDGSTLWSTFFGIYLEGTGLINVSNNVIGSITTANSNTADGTNFCGIIRGSSGITNISNNSIGSTDVGTTNSIFASSIATGGYQFSYGILITMPGTINITGNTISKMTNSNTSSYLLCDVQGIKIHLSLTTKESNITVSNNVIRDLTTAHQNLIPNGSYPEYVALAGIMVSALAPGTQTVSNNTIYNLSGTSATFTEGVGIYYAGGTLSTGIVSGNFIHSLFANPATTNASLQGIRHNSGNATFFNNVISLGGNAAATIYGINEAASVEPGNFYHNTVYVSGNPTSESNLSYSFISDASNTRNVRNNLFINARLNSATASGSHYAIGITNNTNLTIDYNDYFAPNGVLGFYNSLNKNTLTDWATSSGGDTHSLNISPDFASAGGTTAADYIPSPATLVAVAGTGITTDYDGGNSRSLTSPSMGAFEYPVGCTNPTNGGTIAGDQSILSGATPAAFTSSGLPTGHSGTLEYRWQQSTASNSAGFGDIASSNSATFAPGSLTVATWFKRLARVECQSDWAGAAESNVVAITILPSEPTAQATNLYFSNTVSGTNTSIVLNYTASTSATSYLVVRKTGSAPTFVPSDWTSYAIGAQGSDQVVYVGSALTCTDATITKGLTYYYKVYAFNGSNVSSNYRITNPLGGSTICYAGSSATLANNPGTPFSSGFPGQGINVTFPNGTAAATINASKNSGSPSANFSVLPGVRGIANLYFTITSSVASPGAYVLILDFSSLGLSQSKWATFKILKRTNSSSAWKDITTLGGTIAKRQTDGVWGKFTITGLTSFSDFAGGDEASTYTVLSAAETGDGTLKNLIASAIAGDFINFNTTSMGGNTIKLTSPVVIDKDITIQGTDGGIILDGNNATRVITNLHGSTTVLDKLVIKNGNDPLVTVGGVLNEGNLTMINCVVSDNTAIGSMAVGGVLSFDTFPLDGDVLNLINTTIAGNTGDPMDGSGGLSSEDKVNIYNSIIYGNIGYYSDVDETINEIAESYNSLYGNDVSAIITAGASLLFAVDPKFTGGNTHPYALCGNSAGVDAGNNSYCSEATDLRGTTRSLSKIDGTAGTVDMGAYEWRYGTDPMLFTWDGSESEVWNLPANWDLNLVPSSTDVIRIPDVTNKPIADALTVATEGELTIDPKGSLTLNGAITNNGKIVIKSEAGWTGSLIATGVGGTGTALVERFMPQDEWHIISSPTATQQINDFIADNLAIPSLSGTTPVQYGMMDYKTADNKWNGYFTAAKISPLGIGKGYMVRVKNPVDNLRFQGAINASASTSVLAGWNCIGNPFMSAIKVNTAAGTDNFIGANWTKFDDSNKALYFWNQTNNSGEGSYDVVNLADGATYAQIGQGFFMKAKASDNVSFTTTMQTHQINAPFKASATPYPEIKLIAMANAKTVSTDIKFIEGTQKGLDPGYDAGLFTTDKSFSIYTKLVEDNGVNFQLQCLPPTDYSKLVIPVGIDSKAGGEIVLSVQTVQLDPTCKVILEDKLTNTFTDLSKDTYKAAVVANTAGTGRFYLHTGDIVSGFEDQVLTDGKLTAYAKGNTEIHVIGEVGDGSVATLVNGLGQVVLIKKLGAGNLNIIGLPNLTSGLYMLNIDNNGAPQTIKMMIRK
ncbi:MAG: choice-of-anchor Q domain-containing protein [Mariniphaga sp.]